MEYIIFTDLDGTLLDYKTYSFDDAMDAIEVIKKNGVRLVFVTSKTKIETEEIIARIDYDIIFSVENGAAVYFPDGHSKIFGKKLDEAFACAEKIKSECDIKTIFDIDTKKLSEMTGLSTDRVELMKKRDFTLPFVLFDCMPEDVEPLAGMYGFKILKGGRFYHLVAEKQDKGVAVKYIVDKLKNDLQNVKTVGLGDSGNDYELLVNVDLPVVVKKHDGTYDSKLLLVEGAYITRQTGPKGFSEFLLKLFKEEVNG